MAKSIDIADDLSLVCVSLFTISMRVLSAANINTNPAKTEEKKRKRKPHPEREPVQSDPNQFRSKISYRINTAKVKSWCAHLGIYTVVVKWAVVFFKSTPSLLALNMAPRPHIYSNKAIISEPGEPKNIDFVPFNHWALWVSISEIPRCLLLLMKQISNPLELVIDLTTNIADKNFSRATTPDPEAFRAAGWAQFRLFNNSHTNYTNERIKAIGIYPRPSSWMASDCCIDRRTHFQYIWHIQQIRGQLPNICRSTLVVDIAADGDAWYLEARGYGGSGYTGWSTEIIPRLWVHHGSGGHGRRPFRSSRAGGGSGISSSWRISCLSRAPQVRYLDDIWDTRNPLGTNVFENARQSSWRIGFVSSIILGKIYIRIRVS